MTVADLSGPVPRSRLHGFDLSLGESVLSIQLPLAKAAPLVSQIIPFGVVEVAAWLSRLGNLVQVLPVLGKVLS